MAYCMQCKAEIPILTVVCPHCGYDFLDRETPPPQQGWEYSGAADMLLLVGAVASALAAVGSAGLTLMMLGKMLLDPNPFLESLWQLVLSLLGFCLCMANWIVFQRVANLSRDKR